MKSFAKIIVLGFLALVFGISSGWAQTDVGMLKKGVVKITAEFSGSRKVGTGFVVARGNKYLFIVTASHVVEGESEAPKAILVTFFSDQEEPFLAKVVKKEGGDPQGVALLKVKGDVPEDVQVLSWDSATRVSGGEEIHLIGFPRVGGNAWAVTKGTVSGFDGPILKFSGAVAEGNSGGPVLYQGQVIGVVMEVTGQFGNAKPAQIAKFTVENWPGFPRQTVHPVPSSAPQTGLASLVIESIPTNAEVYVDDELVGQTSQGPVVVSGLDPEEYDVMVRKDGFGSWTRTVDLRAGERRTLKAMLQKGQSLVVTGVWKNPDEPTIAYVLQQHGNQVTMTEVTTNAMGTMVTAEGEGQLEGNQVTFMYRTALGTMGQSTATLSEDGQQLVGAYQDFSNMVPVAISLIRIGDVPNNFSSQQASDFNTIQNFGR